MSEVDHYSDPAAEAAVLGSLILDPSYFSEVISILPDEMYFFPTENQLIYRALIDLQQSGQLVFDLVIIRDRLEKMNQLKAVGGAEYLVRLAESVPTAANVVFYAGMVREKYLRRKVRNCANSIAGRTADPKEPIEEAVQNASNDLLDILEEGSKNKSYRMLEEALGDLNFRDDSEYISTGFFEFDQAFYGLGKGHVIIVAGRPGMGKTSLMTEIAFRLIRADQPIAFFSLEMTSRDLAQRILCSRAKVYLTNLIRGSLSDYDKNSVNQFRKEIKASGFIIDETRYLSPSVLRSRIYSLKQRFNIQAVFVDYLQLMRPDHRHRSLYEEITYVSGELKNISLSMDLPVIAGAQLNRSVENREDHRPRLADLKESGAIEQDADVVILLHRPSYYKQKLDEGENPYRAEAIIAKNRRGSTTTIEMTFNPQFCSFRENDGDLF